METPYENVDWTELEACESNADDIPLLLSQVDDDDSGVRSKAIGRLYWRLYNQGTVYQATAKAMPYLFAYLENRDEPDPELADLIAALSCGHGFVQCHRHAPGAFRETLIEMHAARGKTLDDVVDDEMVYINAIRAYVEPRLKLLYPYIDSPSLSCRDSVAQCLGFFPNRDTDNLTVLRNRTTIETDGRVKDTINASIARITMR